LEQSLLTEIQTATGEFFNYAEFGADDINENDIALALSKICRFNGHCLVHYTVAQHLCLVHDLMETQGEDETTRFHGLIHDVGETYLTDIPRPLKNYFAETNGFKSFMKHYIILEDQIINAFASKFIYGPSTEEITKRVKFYDTWALLLEQQHIMMVPKKAWFTQNMGFPEKPDWVDTFFEAGVDQNWEKLFLARLSKFQRVQ
jgi:hypothetical protein